MEVMRALRLPCPVGTVTAVGRLQTALERIKTVRVRLDHRLAH